MRVLERTYVELEFALKELNKSLKRAENILTKFMAEYPANSSIYVSHDGCGIEHYITDFNNTNEMGVAKEKVLVSLHYDREKGKLVAFCDDDSMTDNFAVEDLAYLLEEITEDDYVDRIVSGENDEIS